MVAREELMDRGANQRLELLKQLGERQMLSPLRFHGWESPLRFPMTVRRSSANI
jgi:hypothetical protein